LSDPGFLLAMMGDKNETRGLSAGAATACVCAGAALIGLAPIGMRLAAPEIDPQAIAFWRFAFALPPLLILAAIVRAPIVKPGMLATAGLAFGVEVGLWHLALTLTTVANATFFSNMAPIVAAFAGWLLFKERIAGGFALGAAIALGGAALLTIGRPSAGQSGLAGDALGLLSAVGYAAYLILLNRARRSVHVVPAMLITTTFAMLIALTATLALGERFWPQSAFVWAVLIGLGVVVHVGGQGLIAMGIGRLPIGIATVLLWIQPIAAAMFAWPMFGEAMGPISLLGAALLLGGIYIVQRTRAQ
jgi:drug/metabolite transporter (DMT)-like permease